MNKTQKKLMYMAESALIAAIYAATTYLSAMMGLAYGPIQFRFSEAFCVLAMLTPAAVPGLTIGCIVSNIISPMGIWDLIFGSAATFLAALCARKLRHVRIKDFPLLSLLMPVIFNAVIVGVEITFLLPSDNAGFTAFLMSAFEVGAGELAVCCALGIPLYFALKPLYRRISRHMSS